MICFFFVSRYFFFYPIDSDSLTNFLYARGFHPLEDKGLFLKRDAGGELYKASMTFKLGALK